MVKKSAVFFTHDHCNNIDRRILKFADVLLEHSFSVHICAYSDSGYVQKTLSENVTVSGDVVRPSESSGANDPVWKGSAPKANSICKPSFFIPALDLRLRRSVVQCFRLLGLKDSALYHKSKQLYSYVKGISFRRPQFEILKKTVFSAGSAFSTINDKDLRTLEKIVKGQCDIEALKIPDGVATDWYPLGFTECFKRQSRSLQAELVIACDLPALPAAVEFAHRTRAKLIYDAHEMYPFQKEFSERQKLVLAYYEAKLLPRVDVCVTVSDRIVEFMKNVYGKHLPIYCINNCADFVDGNGVKRVLREKCGINSTDPVFLYHGGFSEGRMLKELGEAFLSSSVMKESYLVYLGSGQLNSELRTLAKTSKGKIFVLDAVAQEDLPGYICDADFVTILYPALDENTKNAFPNKLGDCITLGVPFFGSSEMLTLHDVAERFSIGYVGLARTREQISRELTAAISWRANNKNFDFQGARGALGWGAQRKQFESLVLSLF